MDNLFSMLKFNLFRNPKVQMIKNQNQGFETIDPKMNPDQEEIMLEESWSHISLNYEILLRIIIYPYFPQQLIKTYIDYSFLR